MNNHIMRHIANAIRPMVVNAVNDIIFGPGSSNQPFLVQGNPAALVYVPSTSAQFKNVSNLGQVIPPPVRILQRPKTSSRGQYNANVIGSIDGKNPSSIWVSPAQTNPNDDNNNINLVNQNVRQKMPLPNVENIRPIKQIPNSIM